MVVSTEYGTRAWPACRTPTQPSMAIDPALQSASTT